MNFNDPVNSFITIFSIIIGGNIDILINMYCYYDLKYSFLVFYMFSRFIFKYFILYLFIGLTGYHLIKEYQIRIIN